MTPLEQALADIESAKATVTAAEAAYTSAVSAFNTARTAKEEASMAVDAAESLLWFAYLALIPILLPTGANVPSIPPGSTTPRQQTKPRTTSKRQK